MRAALLDARASRNHVDALGHNLLRPVHQSIHDVVQGLEGFHGRLVSLVDGGILEYDQTPCTL